VSRWLVPNWPAPSHVRAVSTTRSGYFQGQTALGSSQPPYECFNLADHVGDDAAAVAANRAQLAAALQLPAAPVWLEQVHSAGVARLPAAVARPRADASVTTEPGVVCAVLTADCLPVLLCDREGTRVAAAHAGWRGLAGGVLEATVAALNVPGAQLLAWLGPAIGPKAFEVGEEVRAAFVSQDAGTAAAFVPTRPGHWLADLYALARRRLARLDIDAVYGGDCCTFEDPQRFYSYRRDGRTGRMASLIWLEKTDNHKP
jgi:YfiH family protein